MIYNVEGLPLQGLTGGYGHNRRVEFIIPEKSRGFTYQVGVTSIYSAFADPNYLCVYSCTSSMLFHVFIMPCSRESRVTCNAITGLDQMQGDADFENRYFQLNSADLVVPRMEAWHLLWVGFMSSLHSSPRLTYSSSSTGFPGNQRREAILKLSSWY